MTRSNSEPATHPKSAALEAANEVSEQKPSSVINVGQGGFEPPKAMPTGLQPVPFGHSGTDP